MDAQSNIKYYFFCRHKLDEDAAVIGTEIASLFNVKIPIRDGLKNWADCIDNDKKNGFLFSFDEKNKNYFEHLNFEMDSKETKEIKMIQFFALCRYQLSVPIPKIMQELSRLYGKNAPGIITLHSWIISKKKTQLFDQIDLTNEVCQSELANAKEHPKLTSNKKIETKILLKSSCTNSKKDSNIKYYFFCRNKLKVKLAKIRIEMKQLFHKDCYPKSDSILYHWAKIYKTDKKANFLFKYDETEKSGFERLQFRLNVADKNKVKQMQFYALCRHQLNTPQKQIHMELKKLFNTGAPTLSVVKSWLEKFWINNEKPEETDQPIDDEDETRKLSFNEETSDSIIELSSSTSVYSTSTSDRIEELIQESSFDNKMTLRDKEKEIEQLKKNQREMEIKLISTLDLLTQKESLLAKEKRIKNNLMENEADLNAKLYNALDSIRTLQQNIVDLNAENIKYQENFADKFLVSQTELINKSESTVNELKKIHSIETKLLKSEIVHLKEHRPFQELSDLEHSIQSLDEKKCQVTLDNVLALNSKLKETNSMYKDKLERVLFRNDELKNELFIRENEINDLKSAKNILQDTLNKLKSDSDQKVNEISLQLSNTQQTQLIAQIEAKDAKQKISNQLKEIIGYKSEIEQLENTNHLLKVQLEKKNDLIVKIQGDLEKQKIEKQAQINQVEFYKIKLQQSTKEFDTQREENTHLKETRAQLKAELNDLKQSLKNLNEFQEKPNEMLQIKLEEAYIQLKISEKNYNNITNEMESLSNENSNLKAEIQSAHGLVQSQKQKFNELKRNAEQQNLNQFQCYTSLTNELKIQISHLKNQLNESYEFLLEKDNWMKEIEEDLNAFSQCLTGITEHFNKHFFVEKFNSTPIMTVKHIILRQCLERTKTGFESLSNRLRQAEKSKINVLTFPIDPKYLQNKKQVADKPNIIISKKSLPKINVSNQTNSQNN